MADFSAKKKVYSFTFRKHNVKVSYVTTRDRATRQRMLAAIQRALSTLR